ncbi:MAG: acylphosphatase [Candidatus Omnitrophota bacterium]
MKKQVNVIYKGRVQGIGFRFTVESIANKLGVCGWVKNLKDGNAEIMAEGEKENLEKFLKEVNSYFSNYISDTEVFWFSATGKFKDFTIEF